MSKLADQLNVVILHAVLLMLAMPQALWAETKSQINDSSIQQKEFLSSVAPTLRSWKTFEEWAKSLKGAGIVSIRSGNTRIKKAKSEPLVDSAHKLTFAETFETMARQTKSTLRYDSNSHQWVFEEPQMPLPYSISIADGWKMDDRGYYVAYIPNVAPVGMDIYMMGRFVGLNDQQLKDIRDEQALVWADKIHNCITVNDMTKTTVDGAEALYFKTKATVEGRQWRQWAFVKNGQSFVIVSTVDDKNEATLIPDVEKMVQSFHVVEPPVPFPGF